VEEMARKAELEERSVAVAAAILAKGIHRVVELEGETRGVSRWTLPIANREARFFDEV
jgi:hypothetical protein